MSRINQATGFYNSAAWKETRRNYRQAVGYLCERCMKRGIVQTADVVHHRIPLTKETVNDLNLSLNWDNLQALCRKCHQEVHKELSANYMEPRYNIDRNGRVELKDDTVL